MAGYATGSPLPKRPFTDRGSSLPSIFNTNLDEPEPYRFSRCEKSFAKFAQDFALKGLIMGGARNLVRYPASRIFAVHSGLAPHTSFALYLLKITPVMTPSPTK